MRSAETAAFCDAMTLSFSRKDHRGKGSILAAQWNIFLVDHVSPKFFLSRNVTAMSKN